MVDFTVDHRVRFDAENERVKAEIKRTIVALTGRLEEVVKRNLSSGSPYLKVDSGRLRGSVVGRVTEQVDQVKGAVSAGGSHVKYLFIHEFGLTAQVGIKAHLRQIKQAFGKPITPRQVMVGAHSRNVKFRERRMMRDALQEVAKIVPKNIDAAIQRGLNSG
ncbi:hypothetical protein [Acinetobacter populi]|uniref:HK97 gp10 family phage protein n=1 Tax=Acinetobacter populi TaxID=1582270 RepID=A0A1Z9YXQ8_9GAMM|nr:hypothetical protein [Acinetobacter populi]OUY07007.1 hypothetical protein CAP51_09940 [Acinetobacter populi]